MDLSIQLSEEFTTMDQLISYLKSNTSFDVSKEYDHWEVRTDANGQMEQCVFIKKSGMHGAKAYFTYKNTVKMDYIIPNKMLNAYFGNSQKAHKNILEIVTERIKNIFLTGSQKKAFLEIVNSLPVVANN